MRNRSLLLLAVAGLFTLQACNGVNKLLGKDDDDNESSAPAPSPEPEPAPSPAPAPTVQRYDLYRDQGGSYNNDPEFQLRANAPMVLFHIDNGGVEGTKYFRLHTENNSSASMTFDVNLVGRTVDLSARTKLAFQIRLAQRPILPADAIFIYVEDGNGVTGQVPLQSVMGFNPDSIATWQNVSIPLSAFAGIDLTKIKRPFGLSVGIKADGDALDNDPAMVNHLDVDFDDVRYEP